MSKNHLLREIDDEVYDILRGTHVKLLIRSRIIGMTDMHG